MGGSSPLTRGKHVPEAWAAKENGLIPTHAGKTGVSRKARAARRAHPHSRGENSFAASRIGSPAGSSPLTRGKRRRVPRHCLVRGLIPTHAGKTSAILSRRSTQRAHPHSRGENQIQVLKAHLGDGSSPLTRGKPRGTGLGCSRPGLIPTHAGKTRVPRALPRSASGSSPLTRGKLGGCVAHEAGGRLIPTHAGKTR